jgi:hypothetical protein
MGELIRFGKDRIRPSLLKRVSERRTASPSINEPQLKGDVIGWKQSRAEVLWEKSGSTRKSIIDALRKGVLLENPTEEERETLKGLANRLDKGKLKLKIDREGISFEEKE